MNTFLNYTHHVLLICDLTRGSRRNWQSRQVRCRRTPAVNHEPCAFIENKRCQAIPRRIVNVVNRNGGSVYQTDQVFVVYSPRAGAPVGAFSRTSSRRNSTEYVDVQICNSCAACRRVLLQFKPRSGG